MRTNRADAESSELHHLTFLPPALKTASPSHACRDHATPAQGSASSPPTSCPYPACFSYSAPKTRSRGPSQSFRCADDTREKDTPHP